MDVWELIIVDLVLIDDERLVSQVGVGDLVTHRFLLIVQQHHPEFVDLGWNSILFEIQTRPALDHVVIVLQY